MFGRKSTPPADEVPANSVSPTKKATPATTKGKGAATRSRKEAQAARKAQLRAAAQAKSGPARSRNQRRTQREATRQALATGDEKNLPLRDRGPVRKFVRDTVDGRRSPGEFLLFAAFAVMGLGLARQTLLYTVAMALLIVLLLALIIDAFRLRHLLRREITKRFPKEADKGAARYGIMRSTQIRRLRLPPPQVDPAPWKLFGLGNLWRGWRARRAAKKLAKKTAKVQAKNPETPLKTPPKSSSKPAKPGKTAPDTALKK